MLSVEQTTNQQLVVAIHMIHATIRSKRQEIWKYGACDCMAVVGGIIGAEDLIKASIRNTSC